MDIIRDLSNFTKYENIVMTLGKFDGLHIGHQFIIKKVIERAYEIKGHSLVFTFESHPFSLLFPEKNPKQLISLHEKIDKLKKLNIDILVLTEFTKHFSNLTPNEFFEKILIEKINCKEIFIGENFSFGKDKTGNIDILKNLCQKYNVKLNIIKIFDLDNIKVNSTEIRKLITNGKLNLVEKFLERPYSILGKVIKGNGRGKKLGFPTTNLKIHNVVIPPRGVYLCYITYKENYFQGLVNIGFRPTFFENNNFHIEVFIFDFDKDIYHEHLKVSFIKKLRDEIKFSNSEELIIQIKKDVEQSKYEFLQIENKK
ncbi:MAG: bifunctional riboflavin kinase/FAD synthetase [bacterium]